MRDFFALQSRAFRMWFDTVQANNDAMTTIAMRLPMMATESMSGRPPSAEMKRMVSEKVEAAMQGALNGAIATGSLAARAMLGQLNPTRLAHGLMGVAAAAHGPAHRRVKANARRLTGRS